MLILNEYILKLNLRKNYPCFFLTCVNFIHLIAGLGQNSLRYMLNLK